MDTEKKSVSLSDITENTRNRMPADAPDDPDTGSETPPEANMEDSPPDARPEEADTGEAAETAPMESESEAAQKKEEPEKRPRYRFKSHDEAERGYREAQSKMTKDSAELARIKAAYEKLIKEKQARDETERRQKEKEAFQQHVMERRREIYNQIDELDPEADDYTERRAALEAQFEAEARYWEPPPEEASDSAPEPPPEITSRDRERLWKLVEDTARAEGLSVDDPVFLHYQANAPTVDESGRELSFDEQLSRVIEQTKTYHADQAAKTRAAAESPINRGTHREKQPPKEGGVPLTLASTVNDTMRKRRVRK